MKLQTKLEACKLLQQVAREKSSKARYTVDLFWHTASFRACVRDEQKEAATASRVARDILCDIVTERADALYGRTRNIDMEIDIHVAKRKAGELVIY